MIFVGDIFCWNGPQGREEKGKVVVGEVSAGWELILKEIRL